MLHEDCEDAAIQEYDGRISTLPLVFRNKEKYLRYFLLGSLKNVCFYPTVVILK